MVTHLGPLDRVEDINASAQVVGSALTTQGDWRAFLWNSGVLIDLGTLGGSNSMAYGINDAGQVVGDSNLRTDANAYRAFLLTPEDSDGNGTPDRWFRDSNADGANDLMRDLGTLGGTDATSRATDVNNLGQVIGYASWWTSTGYTSRAFLWQNGGMSNLGTLGGQRSAADAINDAGQVTGSFVSAAGEHRAFLRAHGIMTDLGPSNGAADINDAGQLVDSAFGAARRWTPTTPNAANGTFANLGSLPPTDPYYYFGSESYARGINNVGEVVGHQADYIPGGEFGGEGWLYRAVRWLNGNAEELPLQSASAINDFGGIVGTKDGHAYLLTPESAGTPQVTVGDVTVLEGNTGSRVTSISVRLSAASSQTVTVAYATADGTAAAGNDYQATSGTLTIPAGQTTGTISVLVNGDRVPESDESFLINLRSATGATIADGAAVGTITDDEPRVSIDNVTKAEGRRDGTTLFTFVVTLSAAYDRSVTMSFKTLDGTAKTGDGDYVGRTGTLTFAPGETTKTITIEVKGDRKRESDETFYLDLFGLSSNALFTKKRGIGKILNDD